MTNDDAYELNQEYSQLEPIDMLIKANQKFPLSICLASSLGAEDQVLTDMIHKAGVDINIFVLDTGRLHQETYNLMQETMTHYGMKYQMYFPNTKAVETMVNQHGPNLFYENVENRKTCCYIRKVEPLIRALKGKKAWMTGLRRAQSINRATLAIVEWDDEHELTKINPLATWSKQDVWDYIKSNNVPYNKLHDNGFPSIGCEPCTRAIKPGEDDRSGRWWWEQDDEKECGLHVSELPKKENL